MSPPGMRRGEDPASVPLPTPEDWLWLSAAWAPPSPIPLTLPGAHKISMPISQMWKPEAHIGTQREWGWGKEVTGVLGSEWSGQQASRGQSGRYRPWPTVGARPSRSTGLAHLHNARSSFLRPLHLGQPEGRVLGGRSGLPSHPSMGTELGAQWALSSWWVGGTQWAGAQQSCDAE